MSLLELAGAALGAFGGSKKQEATTKNTTDPRFDPYMYGAGGIMPSASQWWQQNPTGMNSQMLTGMNNQWSQLEASKPGFDQMQNLGRNLMGSPIAGNPFTNGAMANGGTPTGVSGASAGGSYQPASYGGSGAFSTPRAMPMSAPQSSNLGFSAQPNYGGDGSMGQGGDGMGYNMGGGFGNPYGFSQAQLDANAAAANNYLGQAFDPGSLLHNCPSSTSSCRAFMARLPALHRVVVVACTVPMAAIRATAARQAAAIRWALAACTRRHTWH